MSPPTTAVRTDFCFGARERNAVGRGVTASDAECMCIRPAAVGDLWFPAENAHRPAVRHLRPTPRAEPAPSVLVRRSFFQPLTRVFVCLSTREQDPPGRLSRIAEPSRAPQKLPQLCWHCSHFWGRCGARPLTPESLLPPLSLLVTPLSLLP